jgi:hypothetical protein
MVSNKTADERVGDDLIIGIEEIAAELRRTRRQAQHLVDAGHVPTFKIGSQRAALRSVLRAHLRQLAETALAA